jgi:transcription initiation factor TFIID TATA-box-binding protein
MAKVLISLAKTKIVNVVATASLNQPIDFSKINEFTEITYRPNTYGGRVAYFKNAEMKGKVSIFFSGKLISVGTKSEAQSFKELRIAEKFLLQKGLIKHIKLLPKTQNLVIVADFGKSIALEELPEKTKAIYEPEQFPGAILRLEEPFKTSILLFASGKAVITGLKSSGQIEPTIHQLKQIIELNKI